MKVINKILLVIPAFLFLGFLLPQNLKIPVEGATKKDYNPETFWYYPWGKSITHKGVDIFAREGTNIRPSTYGLVIYCGQINRGGNVILMLGPRWRFHYFAHLQKIKAKSLSWVSEKEIIATVGSSGNAIGKPPHLHYSIITPIPYFWLADKSRQGWKKMFYLNPVPYLNKIAK